MSVLSRVLLLLAGYCFAAVVLAAPKNDLVTKGEYLATIGGCLSCHTASESKAMAGGLALRTPFGTIFSTNITPDSATGIGDWSFDDFWQALHLGKGYRGKLLYPAFPFTAYTKVIRDDALAIYTYLQSLPAVKQQNREHTLGFPYSFRPALSVWRMLNFKPGEYQPDSSQSEEWNRGAYLVQGLGHCNECHTTRNSLGGVNQKQLFLGGVMPVQEWYAPSLSMQKNGDLIGWTQEDMIALLKTGVSDHGSALGPMAEVVHNSTQHMTDVDLKAMAVYLESIPGPVVKQANMIVADNLAAGQSLYEENCTGCHGKQGEGVQGIYPALAGNTTVNDQHGTNAIRSVLVGGFIVTTQHNPEPYSMPPFAHDLSNEQVAAVVNYIRQSWGNTGSAITAETVKSIRYKPLH